MKSHGFTLIELMIVITIIAIIAAIAIPALINSRRAANEANAASAMRTLTAAQISYKALVVEPHPANGVGQYGDIIELRTSLPPFIDSALGGGSKSGYLFVVTPMDDPQNPTFDINGNPANYPRSGLRSFFADESGVLRFNTDGTPADDTSPPVG